LVHINRARKSIVDRVYVSINGKKREMKWGSGDQAINPYM
jgi:hypothetical protein